LIEEGREWVAGGAQDALLAEAADLVADATDGAEVFSELLASVTEAIPPRGDRDRARRPRDPKHRYNRFIRNAPKNYGAPR
jgi:ATP-dependent Lhr-like helicase